MKFWFLIFVIGCQNYNSNTTDRQRYGAVELENNAQFRAAYAVIQNRCTNCHTSQIHSVWSTYTTNQLWVNSGRVIKGNPQDSPLIERIINTGESHSNMPLNGSALPNDEYDTLVQWVQDIP